MVLVPGFLSLIFDSTVSGESNNFLVNNALRALVNRLTVKFAGEIVQDTDGYDLFKLYEDLFLTESERESIVFREGSQSEDLSKIRCKAGNKYRVPLDYEIRKDHGVFFPRALSDELLFELRLAPASNVVIGSDETQLTYELTNIHLEYKVMHSQELAGDTLFNYTNEKRFRCEHVTHLKAISIDKGTDSIINDTVNAPRRSMRELLLQFYKLYTAVARNSEKTFYPDITEVKVIVNRIPNKICIKGMRTRGMWEEVFRRFGKENSAMNATDFFAADRLCLFIDLRSMKNNNLHSSGLTLVNKKEGIQLVNNRKVSDSGNVKCYIFICSDALLNIINRELESVTY